MARAARKEADGASADPPCEQKFFGSFFKKELLPSLP
jgi:hypothetical protein